MANPQLEKYVMDARAQGVSDEVLRDQLVKAGWKIEEVNAALAPRQPAGLKIPPPPAPQFGMWVTFQYAVFFICLYIVSISLGSILDRFIDFWLPVPTALNVYSFINIQFQLASLIVAFPIFAALFVSLRRRIVKTPSVRGFALRKKLIYITLFIASLIVIGDLIWNINDLLSGNFTANSFGHLVVLLLIAGSVFTYLLWDVKEDRAYASE